MYGVTDMDRDDKRKFLLYFIFVLLLVVRLVKITNPPLDYSSWRQVDTDSIARNFIEYRFNIFYPQLNYDGPMPNYVQLELQITTFIIAILYKIFGYNPGVARMVPIVFFMGSCAYLYRLVKCKSGINAALMTVLFYGILPINIVYSRNIMPESALMFFTLGAMYYFVSWIDGDRLKDYILAVIFTALTILTKIPGALIGIPMIYLSFKKYGFMAFKNKKLYAFLIITLGTPYLYFTLLGNIAEQKFVSGIGSDMVLPNFLSAIYEKETAKYLAEQFALKIFTLPGVLLFSLGVVMKMEREEYFYYAWLLGSIFHVIVVDSVIHLDYYLMFITPVISIFAGSATARLFTYKSFRYFLYIGLLIITLNDIVFMGAAYKLQGHYIVLGNLISQHTNADDLIIIDRDSPELLYTSGRKGWRLYGGLLTEYNIEELVSQGADYFIVSSPELSSRVLDYLESNFDSVPLGQGYHMYRLSS